MVIITQGFGDISVSFSLNRVVVGPSYRERERAFIFGPPKDKISVQMAHPTRLPLSLCLKTETQAVQERSCDISSLTCRTASQIQFTALTGLCGLNSLSRVVCSAEGAFGDT